MSKVKKGINHSSLILALVIILFIVVTLKGIFTISLSTQEKNKENRQSSTPNVTTAPYTKGGIYKSGEQINRFHFSLIYPNGWSVRQQLSGDVKNRVSFDLIPPDIVSHQGVNLLWGGFSVDVNSPSTSIEEWFNNWLKVPINGMNSEFNKREYYVYSTKQIGNKTAYLIKTSSQAPTLLQEGFDPRYIVLGTYYSYEISFFQNGIGDFGTRIENEIFPGLKFD